MSKALKCFIAAAIVMGFALDSLSMYLLASSMLVARGVLHWVEFKSQD